MALYLDEPSKLPPELYHEIINHLHGDLATLSSCALVCSTWLRSSRHHLSHQRDIYERHAADLAELLAGNSSACTLTSTLAICHLRVDSGDCKDILALNASLRNVRDSDRTASIQLRRLSIVNLHWSDLSNDAIADLLSFRMIRELYVEKNLFPNLKRFVDLLRAFPHLQRLEIDCSHAVGGNSSVSNSTRNINCETSVMPNLQVLKIVEDLVQPSLRYLSPSKNYSMLHDISVLSLRSEDVPSVCEFVKGLGSNIKTLELGLRGQEPLEELVALSRQCKLGTFAMLPGLESFRIELAPPRTLFQVCRTPGSWFLTCMSVCLTHLNARSLEHLRFSFRVDEDSLDLRDWASIADTMAKPCFSRLKTLVFEVQGDSGYRKRVVEKIRLHLKDYDKWGVLRFAELRC